MHGIWVRIRQKRIESIFSWIKCMWFFCLNNGTVAVWRDPPLINWTQWHIHSPFHLSPVKQKKPSMSWTYPIKRSATQTKTNPIVYFRAFFTCCNKKEKEFEWGEIILFVSEGRGSSFSWLWTITSASYIGWMKIKFGPGRDNVSLPVLFKVLFQSPKHKGLEGWEKIPLSAQKGRIKREKRHDVMAVVRYITS